MSDAGRGWRDEREMSCLESGTAIPSNLEDSFTQHYTSHISLSVTNNNHRLRDTHIGVLISVRDLVTLSISSLRCHYLTSPAPAPVCRRVSEQLRITREPVYCALYCAVLCAPVQAATRQSRAITAMLSQMDQRGHQVIVCKKIYFVRIFKADI